MKEFEEKKITLLNGTTQNYFINPNPKSHIAVANTCKKRIEVNQRFENLTTNEKLAIIYHELGHLDFKLYNSFRKVSQCMSLLSIGLPVIFLLLNAAFHNDPFNLPTTIWITLILLVIFILVLQTSIYWLLEIIADMNSIQRIDKKYLIGVISREYSGTKIKFIGKYITHPPWKLRKKIIEGFR